MDCDSTVSLDRTFASWSVINAKKEHLFAMCILTGMIKFSESFDFSFLGLNGAIDAEMAQALLFGKNDITKK